jgi:hypothetical protein
MQQHAAAACSSGMQGLATGNYLKEVAHAVVQQMAEKQLLL